MLGEGRKEKGRGEEGGLSRSMRSFKYPENRLTITVRRERESEGEEGRAAEVQPASPQALMPL